MQRTVPFGLTTYTLAILWYARHGNPTADVAHRLLSPWYTRKTERPGRTVEPTHQRRPWQHGEFKVRSRALTCTFDASLRPNRRTLALAWLVVPHVCAGRWVVIRLSDP